jgi:hypothetical protein
VQTSPSAHQRLSRHGSLVNLVVQLRALNRGTAEDREPGVSSRLLDLGSDLTVDVLQRDCVSACQLYMIEGYRESLVVHQVEIPRS